MSPRSIPENQPPLFHDFKKTPEYQELTIKYEIERNELETAHYERVRDAFAMFLYEHSKGAK